MLCWERKIDLIFSWYPTTWKNQNFELKNTYLHLISPLILFLEKKIFICLDGIMVKKSICTEFYSIQIFRKITSTQMIKNLVKKFPQIFHQKLGNPTSN